MLKVGRINIIIIHVRGMEGIEVLSEYNNSSCRDDLSSMQYNFTIVVEIVVAEDVLEQAPLPLVEMMKMFLMEAALDVVALLLISIT